MLKPASKGGRKATQFVNNIFAHDCLPFDWSGLCSGLFSSTKRAVRLTWALH